MRFFDDDRLHMNPLGHHEVARMVLRALNVPNDLQPMQPDPLPVRTWREARSESTWCGRATYFVPWVLRRVRHESSGDEITAKRPDPLPVTHAGAAEGSAADPASRSSAPAALERYPALPQRPERDGARRGDVERVDAAGHRDRHDRVGRRQRAAAQAVALGAEQQRDALGPVRGEVVERHGVVGERERREVEPGARAGCRAPRSTPAAASTAPGTPCPCSPARSGGTAGRRSAG